MLFAVSKTASKNQNITNIWTACCNSKAARKMVKKDLETGSASFISNGLPSRISTVGKDQME